MKSKIEKLDHIDCITYKNRAILEGDITIVTEETVSKILRKQNEIIDYLNSQDQEEENTVCEGCGKTITSRFMQSYTKGDGMHSYCLSCDPEKQDTPGEWENEIRGLVWRMRYSSTKDYYEKKLPEELIIKIKQLLEERERGVLEEINKNLGTNLKMVDGEIKVVFRKLDKLRDKK